MARTQGRDQWFSSRALTGAPPAFSTRAVRCLDTWRSQWCCCLACLISTTLVSLAPHYLLIDQTPPACCCGCHAPSLHADVHPGPPLLLWY
ncbi:hypothetical protein BD309DRAFT_965679 [Dichomitus squalens]|nr:hypothetical protein BD309DRAFT_965679 [Dichomitus squalens]